MARGGDDWDLFFVFPCSVVAILGFAVYNAVSCGSFWEFWLCFLHSSEGAYGIWGDGLGFLFCNSGF